LSGLAGGGLFLADADGIQLVENNGLLFANAGDLAVMD